MVKWFKMMYRGFYRTEMKKEVKKHFAFTNEAKYLTILRYIEDILIA